MSLSRQCFGVRCRARTPSRQRLEQFYKQHSMLIVVERTTVILALSILLCERERSRVCS